MSDTFTLTLNREPPAGGNGEPIPDTTMVSVAFGNDGKLENGQFTGTIFALKTNTFPPEFDLKTLQLITQIKNKAGQILQLSFKSFSFGGTTQFSNPFNSIQLNETEIDVELFCWTSNNEPLSLVQTRSFSETEPPPPPPPPPPTATVPDPPIMDEASLVTETTTRLSWKAPINDGGSPVIGYRLTVVRNSDNFLTFNQDIGNVLFFDLTGLDLNTEYRTGVRASNSVGESVASNIIFWNTLGAPIEPIPDESMAIITAQNFKIENNRVLGSVAIVATPQFDPFFNDLPLTLFTQIKNPAGQVLVLKENIIFFNDTVREQIINIDESAFDETKLSIELFTWDSQNRAYASPVVFDLEAVISPPVDDPNTFTQDFTVVEYKATPLGKSLFVQIQVTKNVEPQNNIVKSFLQVMRQDRTVINLESQDIDVAGANAFAIVYDIPDLNQPTASIFVQHFIQTLEGIALSDAIEVPANIDQPAPIPTPEKGDNFFNKLIGVFAGATALSVYLSTRKKR